MPVLSRRPLRIAAPAAVLTILLTATLLLPAAAEPVPGTDQFPKVAFVARNDVPFDALTVGPIAGALGGIIVITSPASLGAAARDALIAFDPDLVVIAGGTAAISEATAAQIAAGGGWDVVRKSGPTRDQTAAALATLLDDLGVGRPALSGDRQIVGDVTVGGTVHVDDLVVQSPMVFKGSLLGNVDLAGATSQATAAEILKIENLPAGEYVIAGHLTAQVRLDPDTVRSQVNCRALVDGTEVAVATARVGIEGGQSQSVTSPLAGHHHVASGTFDLEVRCNTIALMGGAPGIVGFDLTQVIATRIP